MISDRYKSLTRRTVTHTADGGGSVSESTADTTITGYIAEMSGAERLRNKQLGNEATAELFTEAVLNLTDRVIDGATEYEIVWKYSAFHLRYALKQVK